jgi:hypothetical protein
MLVFASTSQVFASALAKSIDLLVKAEVPAQMLVNNNIDPSTTDEVKLVPTGY